MPSIHPTARRCSRAASLGLLTLALLTGCDDDSVQPPGGAELSANVSGLSFGVREATGADIVRTFTVTNSGTALSEPLVVTIEGTGAASFELNEAESTCIDLELSPDETCVVSISFGGTAAGPQSATAFVDAGDDEPRIGVTLNGIQQATVSIIKQGTGQGSVRAGQDGPSCSPVCSLTLVTSTVTLTALPATGSRFVEWTAPVSCGTNTQCTLTLSDLNSVTVRFDLQ
jgi:hypothetical protein